MEKIRKQYTFTGHVQGVGFRYSAQYLAQAIGVTGWVKNERMFRLSLVFTAIII